MRLFLDLLELSDSSLWVGSTETFLGLPRVTREDAMAMPVSRDSEHALQSRERWQYLESRGGRGCGLLSAS